MGGISGILVGELDNDSHRWIMDVSMGSLFMRCPILSFSMAKREGSRLLSCLSLQHSAASVLKVDAWALFFNKFTVYRFQIHESIGSLEALVLLLLDTLLVAGAHGVSGLTRGLWYTSKPLWCRKTTASHVRCFQSALGEDGIPWADKDFPKFEGQS